MSAASIDNGVFFGDATSPRGPAIVPEVEFYGDSRPPTEPGFVVRAAERPFRFGAILLGLGWLGILAQLSPLRQLVVGAPVFEELAKFGLALAVVTFLGARSAIARLPYAWLSGLGFGVLEHALTYADEPWAFLMVRAGFHAAACGLSMAVYSALEPLADVRARWGATLASSLVHWANNFGAFALAVLALAAPALDAVGPWWAVVTSLAAVALTIAAVAYEAPLRDAAGRAAARILQTRAVIG